MKNIFLLSIALIFSILTVTAQTSVKLPSGTVISSNNNNDGYNYNQGTDVGGNKAGNCFDGNLDTFFASSIDESNANGGSKGSRGAKGGWVGLDLGSKHIITSVKYAPRPANPERVECGIIEGANSPDFFDAVAIGIIPQAGIPNQYSTLAINSTRGFRYVRFYGSLQTRCNIAELEFWGYQNNGNDTHIGQITNLPTVNIHTINEERINSKEIYVRGYITIVDGSTIVNDSINIRGRGNASWDFKKRPYRIKLDSSTKIFGSPATARNWTLLSNEGDKTLIRNLLAFDISKRMEMPYTPAGKLVDVVLNGDYKGTYQLCDHIDIRVGRVQINEMEATDVSGAALTGGYLMEYQREPKGDQDFTSNRGFAVEIKSPDDDIRVAAQTNYIKNHFNTWETSVRNNNNISQYTDIESFVRFFLMEEFTGNTDTYHQTYIYKKRNDDKFYFGPGWDFDIAYDNDMRIVYTNDNAQRTNQWLYHGGQGNVPMCGYCNGHWQGSISDDMRDMIDRLLANTEIAQKMQDIWARYRNSGAISEQTLLQVIDNYAAQITVSQDLNFKRWDYLNDWTHMMEGRGSYEDNINILKNYITGTGNTKGRLQWFDDKMQYVPSGINNPVFNSVNIFTNENELNIKNLTEQTQISIFDIAGRKIFEANADNNFSTVLPQGAYIVQLTSKSGNTGSFKVLMR
ncbi:MAG: CotH kinase family protein [Prevotellaceae bacterium]|jgi:hypothetical protein|nr:CotH kinase family protein [Prevotellaceae bacterium]